MEFVFDPLPDDNDNNEEDDNDEYDDDNKDDNGDDEDDNNDDKADDNDNGMTILGLVQVPLHCNSLLYSIKNLFMR